MAKFNREDFHYHGGYLNYGYVGMRGEEYVREDEFIGRFKYGGMGVFKTFLIKNFRVEEYFGKLDAGFAPLTILESKGFVSHNVRKAMKMKGYKRFNTATWREYWKIEMKERHDIDVDFADDDLKYAAINAVAA